ncbi:MAG: hypothetical protein ACM3QS_04850, partial [Bacteroidota bacterium]
MQDGNLHVIFSGIADPAVPVLRVELRRYSGRYELRAGLLNDAAAWIFTPWLGISDARHYFELDWRASASPGENNGGLTLWLDGIWRYNRTGVDNDSRRIDRIRLGALAGIDPGTRGIYYLDAFVSRRRSYIGPAP